MYSYLFKAYWHILYFVVPQCHVGDLHSSPGGGGNAPLWCFIHCHQTKQERKTGWIFALIWSEERTGDFNGEHMCLRHTSTNLQLKTAGLIKYLVYQQCNFRRRCEISPTYCVSKYYVVKLECFSAHIDFHRGWRIRRLIISSILGKYEQRMLRPSRGPMPPTASTT